MARQIILMNAVDGGGLRRITCAFWIPVDPTLAVPNPRARSALLGAAAPTTGADSEQEKLEAGTVVEQVHDFLVPDNMTKANIEALLVSAYARVVAAYKPQGTFYGAAHDGTQWSARPA